MTMTLIPTFLSKPESAVNRTFLMLTVVALGACAKSETKVATIPTATIQRRDIVVNAEATGIIEPINVIEVKSKTASGQVTKMSIEIGTFVKPGDLIVQIDTTDLHTQFEQSKADLAAATSNFEVAKAQLARQQQLFKERIITQSELETAQTAYANAQATLLRNQGTRDLNAQRLTDATVRASVTGTIITKPVSLGQVIQAGGGSVSGGSVIATMADLTKVRARALVNETDIGAVAAGQPATVTVDAFPDRVFRGIVEKIEPSATVQQNVTMFPVLISLDNSDGLLRPGMNGEVAVLTDERLGVIAVPNDAIRSPREATVAAGLLGLNPDSVRAAIDVLAMSAKPRLLVLGDMGEVGQQGFAFHTEVGEYATQQHIEHVLTLGELSRHTASACAQAQHCQDMVELQDKVNALLPSVATVLVKGSRFMRMERVVQAIQPSHQQLSALPQQEASCC